MCGTLDYLPHAMDEFQCCWQAVYSAVWLLQCCCLWSYWDSQPKNG
ncbi:hypothetical protein RchiOBHm_Chr5g0030751 [Rosa chinensis]|uniref:Uncharacterized protein n=1 Tax=Rosa chinensis TaxID=74649 RepID=A0A2P6QA17_ROSCH|nr:hypothetical protein RchiOBHm_Chr5g0030751 [Rosa chinensis]